jgi:excisionase family DNA binding protein
MRPREAAEYLGLSPRTLEKLRAQGGGPRFAALGRAIAYAVADLDAWARAREAANTAEARALRRAART